MLSQGSEQLLPYGPHTMLASSASPTLSKFVLCRDPSLRNERCTPAKPIGTILFPAMCTCCNRNTSPFSPQYSLEHTQKLQVVKVSQRSLFLPDEVSAATLPTQGRQQSLRSFQHQMAWQEFSTALSLWQSNTLESVSDVPTSSEISPLRRIKLYLKILTDCGIFLVQVWD